MRNNFDKLLMFSLFSVCVDIVLNHLRQSDRVYNSRAKDLYNIYFLILLV